MKHLTPILLALALSAALPAHAAAATDPAPPPATAATGQKPATLEVSGRDIVTFRAAPSGRQPKERVEGAKRHLFAAYQRNAQPAISVKAIEGGTQVLVDGKVMFAVLEGDVDRTNGETPDEIAALALERLRKVVAELDEQRDPRAILTGAGLAVAATLVWLLLLRGLVAVDRRVGRWAARKAGERVQNLKASGLNLLDEGHFIRLTCTAVHALAWVFGLLLTLAWLNAALRAVPQSRAWGERLTGMIVDVLATIGNGTLEALPGLLFVAVIVLIARFVAGAIGRFFDRVKRDGLNYGWLDRDTAQPTKLVFTMVVWLFALAMAYPYLPGAQSQAFQGLSVLVGLMVSIGASGTVGQAASGLILMYTRTFRLGEFVNIQGTEGTVVELGLFSTRIRTGMGEEVILPNTYVLGNTTRNYSRVVPGTGFIVDTTVTIGYDTPWRQVHAMLAEAARRVPAIADHPAPRVMQTALSDFYPEYRLIAYSRAEAPVPRAVAMSQLHEAIQDVFNEYGVQIMSPHYLGDPADAKVVPKARWYEKPAVPPAG
jgi:small-conductance mechanosensitive channel